MLVKYVLCMEGIKKKKFTKVKKVFIFFFKQKTAYEIGTGDWSSDVCSSDLRRFAQLPLIPEEHFEIAHVPLGGLFRPCAFNA